MNRWFRHGVVAGMLVLACAVAHAAPAPNPISIDADKAPLPTVLKLLAEKGNLNIVTGPGVTDALITVHFKEVPVDQAVNLVVRAAGLAYERIGNSILVAEGKSLKDETGLGSYVVNLKYADAEEVKLALANMAAQISVDRGGNRLIVVTSPRVISEIESIVSELDRPARQVMLEARVVEVSTDDAKKLGVDWDKLNQQSVIIVENTPEASAPGSLPEKVGYIPAGDRPRVSHQAKAIQAALDLMIREGNARVLANPKIATLNGKAATMLVGQRIPFQVTGTTFAGGGAAQTSTIQREEVGIKLSITPLINADGYITTIIRPEVSSVTGFRGANNDLPVVATRQAETTVRLKDGSSVIIGGLLSEEKSSNITKLPLLGDIPLLGLLFQHVSSTTAKKDLVIEVTPRIIGEQP